MSRIFTVILFCMHIDIHSLVLTDARSAAT